VRFIIITPSLNQLDFLRRCVASVRDQVTEGSAHGAEDIEVHHHIQDGGSTDGTVEWLLQHRLEVESGKREEAGLSAEAESKRTEDRGPRRDAEVSAKEEGRRAGRVWEYGSVGAGECGILNVFPDVQRLKSNGYSFSFSSEKDEGMYDALNKGLAFVDGGPRSEDRSQRRVDSKYSASDIPHFTTYKSRDAVVAWLNCDEQYLPRALRKAAGWFQTHPGKNILFGSVVIVDERSRYICSRKPVIPFKWHVAADHLPILSAALFVRRCVFCEEPWFDPSWKNRGDSEWILRLLNRKVSMGASADHFSAFCDRESSLGMNEDSLTEQEQLAAGLPTVIRRMRVLWVVVNRIRKLMSGGYFQRPFQYAVYCGENDARTAFSVVRPKTRWECRRRKLC